MLLKQAASITWAFKRGLGPGNLNFFGLQMALSYRHNPRPLALIMDAARIKRISHGAILIIGA